MIKSNFMYEIRCDRCKRMFFDHESFNWFDSAGEARDIAEGYDWLVLDGKDICDTCATDEDWKRLGAKP